MNIAVIINLFPGVLAMIAVYFILKSIGLTNSHLGLIFVYSASSGLGYLIAKGFLDTVPVSLREAAYLDGASEAKVFWRVVMPMSKPIIVYTVISLPRTVDGFRLCEDDAQFRCRIPVDGGNRTL